MTNNNDKLVVEALKSLLHIGGGIGNSDDAKPDESNSFVRMHEQINDLFKLKVIDLNHHDGVVSAFNKVHNYRYLDDPEFELSFKKELTAQGVIASEIQKAIAAIYEVKKTLDSESEKDYGYNPDMDKIIKVSQPKLYQ